MENQNISACLLAFGFLGASVYTMMTCPTCSPFLEYQRSLSPQLQLVYRGVVKERSQIYLQGLILGTVLALGFLYYSQGTFNPLTNICLFTLIALGTQYFYYSLMPKSTHMLPLLENQNQVENWHEVYHHMKQRYHVGMLLGMIGYGFLAWGLGRSA